MEKNNTLKWKRKWNTTTDNATIFPLVELAEMQHIALPFACESTHENKCNPHNNAIIGILEDATYRMQSMEIKCNQVKRSNTFKHGNTTWTNKESTERPCFRCKSFKHDTWKHLKKLKGQRSGEQVIWPLFRGSMVFFCFSFINSDFAATFLDWCYC